MSVPSRPSHIPNVMHTTKISVNDNTINVFNAFSSRQNLMLKQITPVSNRKI